MKLNSSKLKPSYSLILTLITASAFLLIGFQDGQTAVGQSWSVNQSPINSVPQYIPRHPLGNPGAETDPASTTKVAPKPTTTTPQVKRPAVTKKPTPKKPTPKKTTSSKSSSSKKSSAKKAADDKAKKEVKKVDPHYGVDYSVHRDRNVYPIDPRKPYSPCVRPCDVQTCGGCGGKLFGNKGRPYLEKEPGGCTCQKKKPTKRPMFSIHWPRPFSAWLDERYPEKAAARYGPCQEERCIDALNHLSKIKPCDYKRTDNAFSGPGADPYGCLSESKQAMAIPTHAQMHYYDSGPHGYAFQETGEVQTAGYESVVDDLDSVGDRFSSFDWPTMR